MGELILQEGIPKTDPFSYTMPTFHFVDHEWIISILYYLSYPAIGKLGLSLIFTTLFSITMIVTTSQNGKFLDDGLHRAIGLKGARLSALFFLALASMLEFYGVRPQTVSWLYFSLLVSLLFKKRLWKKWHFLLPVLVFIWSNTHGTFVVAIATMSILFFIRSLKRKIVDRTELWVLVLSLVATLANPYGFGLWKEVWIVMTDAKLRWTIQEWMPFFTSFNLPAIVFLALSTVFVFRHRKLFSLDRLLLYMFFLLQAMLSHRHVPFWIIFTYPMTLEAVVEFYRDMRNIKLAQSRFKVAYRILWTVSVGILVWQIANGYFFCQRFSENKFYPKEASKHLKENLPDGEIFTSYGWGGYLIWKLPEKKVFIDGRMPSWRLKNELGEGKAGAIDYYGEIVKGEKKHDYYFEKYNINTVLWDQRVPETRVRSVIKHILKPLLHAEDSFDLIGALESDGWNKIYEDNKSVIYGRKPSL